MKKKIAFCLYGQPRCYKTGFDNINKFVTSNTSDYTFDFFFHTWIINENERYNVSPWRNINNNEMIHNNCETDLISLYKPSAYEFEKQIDQFDENLYINSIVYNNAPNYIKKNTNNILSQFYSKNKVRNILCNYINNKNEKYDAVIVCRFDYQNPININLNNINLSYISISHFQKPINILPTSFLIAPVEVFQKWFTFYENFHNINNNIDLSLKMQKYNVEYILNAENMELANFLYFFNNFDNINFTNSILNFV